MQLDLAGGWNAFFRRAKSDLLGAGEMMKRRGKAIAVWVILGVCTVLIYAFSSMDVGWQWLLFAAFAGISWNIFAYGADKGM